MISLVVAVSENGVIGRGGELPWHLPADLKYFSELTKGHVVVMGRRTYESIIKKLGTPLPERQNIVLTTKKDFIAVGGTVVSSWEELEKAVHPSGPEEVFVIGGSQVFKEALPKAECLYKTTVHARVEGDAFFPTINPSEWRLLKEVHRPADEKNQYAMTFAVYERKRTMG